MSIISDLYKQQLMDKYGVAWFKFDEASGNITDSKGSAVGTISGGVTRVTGWNGTGSALSFNGTNGYVQFNQKVIPLGKKSIRFRIKTTQSTGLNYILNTTNSATEYGESISINDGKIRYTSSNGVVGNYRFDITSIKNVSDAEWHDILIVNNGTTSLNGIKIYIDNLIVPNITGTSPTLDTVVHTNNLKLGTNKDGNSYFFSGQLDNLEIYNDVFNPNLERILLSSNPKKLSINGDKLVNLDNQSEMTFFNHGIKNEIGLTANVVLNGVNDITSSSQVLGVGKTFTHTINLDKYKGKSITL